MSNCGSQSLTDPPPVGCVPPQSCDSGDYVQPRSDLKADDDDYLPLPSQRVDTTRPLFVCDDGDDDDEPEDIAPLPPTSPGYHTSVGDEPDHIAPPPPCPPPCRFNKSRSASVVEPPTQSQLIIPNSNRSNSKPNVSHPADKPPPLPARPADLPTLKAERTRKISLPALLPSRSPHTFPQATETSKKFTRHPAPTIPETPSPNFKRPLPQPPTTRRSRNSVSDSCSSPSGESMTSLNSRGSFSEHQDYYDGQYGSVTPQPCLPCELNSYIWYHHDTTDRSEANRRLESIPENGAFLIRPRAEHNMYTGEPYAIHIYQLPYKKIHMLKIRQRKDHKFALGTAKPAEKAFLSLAELVEFHRNNPLKVDGYEEDGIFLTRSPRKSHQH